MDSLSVDHLLGIKYLNKHDLELIFRTAETFTEVLSRPIKKVPSLNGVTIANLFSKTAPAQGRRSNWRRNAFRPTSLIFRHPYRL